MVRKVDSSLPFQFRSIIYIGIPIRRFLFDSWNYSLTTLRVRGKARSKYTQRERERETVRSLDIRAVMYESYHEPIDCSKLVERTTRTVISPPVTKTCEIERNRRLNRTKKKDGTHESKLKKDCKASHRNERYVNFLLKEGSERWIPYSSRQENLKGKDPPFDPDAPKAKIWRDVYAKTKTPPVRKFRNVANGLARMKSARDVAIMLRDPKHSGERTGRYE